MRLDRLDLIRFGKFTDTPLAFPASECDLHLIVGANEAGKSTVRQAILDLFYNIDRSSPYRFKHGLTELELGGVVQAGGVTLPLRRLKRNKDPLVDPAGKPLPDGTMERLLGGADQKFYERMFGLNHPTLIAGARELLNSSGDVGQMLFQAAAGVTGLHKLRQRLEADAYALWGDRKRGDASYYIGLQQYQEAEKRLKEVGVSSGKWLAVKREQDAAEADAEAAQARYVACERERQRLERVRRVAGPLRQREEASALLATLGAPPLLDADAGAVFAAAATEIAQARGTHDLLARRVDDEAAALAGIIVNTVVLDHQAEIETLEGRVAAYLTAGEDLPALQAQIDARTGAAISLARQIDWPESTLAAIEAKLPSRPVRSELQALSRTHAALALAATQARAVHAASRETIDALKGKIAGAPAATPLPAVATALKQAVALNLDERTARTVEKVQAGETRLAAAMGLLAPWAGDEPTLRALTLPQAGEWQEVTTRQGALAARRDQLVVALRGKRVDAAKAKARLDAYTEQHRPVTAEAIATSRDTRDAVWRQVRAGELAPAAAGDRYEGLVESADRLADQRYHDAARTEQGHTLAVEHAALQAEIDELAAQDAATEGALAALRQDWNRRMQALGLEVSVAQFPAWVQGRDRALAAAAALAEARAEQRELAAASRACVAALRTALADAGAGAPGAADLPLLITRAEALQQEQAEAAARVESWREQRDAAEVALPALEHNDNAAREALDNWQAAWTRQLAAAGLDPAMGTAAAANALEIQTQIDDACRHVKDNAAPRVVQMTLELDGFARRAKELARTCAPDIADLAPTEIAARLRELLRGALQGQLSHASTAAALQKTRADLAAAEEARVRAEARIRPLLDAARVATIDELRAAIAAADDYRAVHTRMTNAGEAARNGGDNLPLAVLQDEVAAVDPAQIEVLLEDAARARRDAQDARDACIRRHATAKAAFDLIAGQDDAVRAESLRRDAMLGMGEAVDEYVRITVGARLVKWAVDRYSEEQQQPLLKRASGLFARLTDGRFTKLSVNFEASPPALNAHRADGTFVAIGGLSTGTEDQLFLALRLAALDLHLDAGTPLPFIADDIFINWSDDRAAAGFGVLAELATRTQVIMLSHHHHLVDIARRHTGGRVNVIELSA